MARKQKSTNWAELYNRLRTLKAKKLTAYAVTERLENGERLFCALGACDRDWARKADKYGAGDIETDRVTKRLVDRGIIANAEDAATIFSENDREVAHYDRNGLWDRGESESERYGRMLAWLKNRAIVAGQLAPFEVAVK